MYSNSALNSYKQVAAQTASPGQLVLMLYDGAVRFLRQALNAFTCEDPIEFNQTIHNNVQRAQAIIDELNCSLDMEKGGEFSDRLRQLYDYMDRRLDESNRLKREEGIEEVLRHVLVLRDAWEEMLNKPGSTPSSLPSAAAA